MHAEHNEVLDFRTQFKDQKSIGSIEKSITVGSSRLSVGTGSHGRLHYWGASNIGLHAI